MIINGIQHLGTAVPPRDHGDRAPQQAPPHEPAVTMGDCGLDLRDGSVVRRSKTRGTGYLSHLHAAGGRTSSELSRTTRAVHARRARLALTREGVARQLVRLAVVRRHRLHPDIGIVRAVDRCARSGTGPDGKPWVRPAYRAARLKPSNSLKRAIREAGRQLEGAS